MSSPSGACTLLWQAMQCCEVAKRRCPGGSAPGGTAGSAARLKLTIKPDRAVTKPKAPVIRRRFLVLRIIRIFFAALIQIDTSTNDIASIETHCVLLRNCTFALSRGRCEADHDADFFKHKICGDDGCERCCALGTRSDRRSVSADAARRPRALQRKLRDLSWRRRHRQRAS